jgi:hypothetical protein
MEPEQIIKSIPEEEHEDKYCGSIKMKFMRMMPSFKIIEKNLPLSFVFNSLYAIKKEYSSNGILLFLSSNNLKIKDYFLFVKAILKNQKVEVTDLQRAGEKGVPDFKVIGEDGFEFYIEFKSMNDSVRPVQLQWMGDNADKEVWFLILENIETQIESEERDSFRIWNLENNRKELISVISKDICSNISNNLQNIQTKIPEKEDLNGTN